MLFMEIIVYGLFSYFLIGILFSLYFSFVGVKKFDDAAKTAGIGFRLIIFFGVVALWPILAFRFLRKTPVPTETNSHRAAAGGSK